METRVRTEPWVIPWQKSTGKADGLLLVVWPARLFSWLLVGISEYGWGQCDINISNLKGFVINPLLLIPTSWYGMI